jgi:hypothetical protein
MDKLKLLPKSSDDISELIIARNKASILFQDKIKKNNDLLSHKRNMERFFVALELFENLQQYSDSIASFQDRYFINPIIS